MKEGDVVYHRAWKIPVLLVRKWSPQVVDFPRTYWEVLLDGEIELVKQSEIEELKKEHK
tara:strand:+ start:1782 stop:1958 length:177 start_codon:yes stop_codon:yes gene_type:complete